MIVYHITKTKKATDSIKKNRILRVNKSLLCPNENLVYLWLTKPTIKNGVALDVIGEDTNRAWIFTLEISDETKLSDDPSGEDKIYGGVWKIAKKNIKIEKIIDVKYIKNIRDWDE